MSPAIIKTIPLILDLTLIGVSRLLSLLSLLSLLGLLSPVES